MLIGPPSVKWQRLASSVSTEVKMENLRRNEYEQIEQSFIEKTAEEVHVILSEMAGTVDIN